MKISRVILPMLFAVFLSQLSLAQGNDGLPPGCCSSPVPEQDSKPQSRDPQMKVVISDAMLNAMGITRSEFLDRLGAALSGKPMYVILSSTSITRNQQPEAGVQTGGTEQSLLAVQVRRFYQFSRDQVSSEDIDGLDHLYMTDGELYLDLHFQRKSSWTTESWADK